MVVGNVQLAGSMEFSVRMGVEEDQAAIDALPFPELTDRRKLFGRQHTGALLETSLLSAVVTEVPSGRIVAFAALDDKIAPAFGRWAQVSEYLRKKLLVGKSNGCVLLTAFQRDDSAPEDLVLAHLFNFAFQMRPEVGGIVLPVAHGAPLEDMRLFVQTFAFCDHVYLSDAGLLRFFRTSRSDFLPPFVIRHATPKDCERIPAVVEQDRVLRKWKAGAAQHAWFDVHTIARALRTPESQRTCLVAYSTDKARPSAFLTCTTRVPEDTMDNHAKLFSALYQQRPIVPPPGGLSALGLVPPRIVICGSPASGRTTQCEMLVEEFNLVHLSTGAMVRAHVHSGSALGLKAKPYMDAGALIPDGLILTMILDRLNAEDCRKRGWVLDGFPRTPVQARSMIIEHIIPDLVVTLDLSEGEALKRVAGRRLDPVTNKMYDIASHPPPPGAILERLVQRPADREEQIRQRMSNYHDSREAVLEAFLKTAKIINIDAVKAKDGIAKRIRRELYLTKKIRMPLKLKRPPRLVIFGPPASGKGTQCEWLVRMYHVVHLSTGDMLRSAIREKSELGLQAKKFMDAGELVPDELVIDLILDRLKQRDCAERGWLLDGFPRTQAQAAAMIAKGILPDALLVLEVLDDEVVRRIAGRVLDPVSNKTFHLQTNPPPRDIAPRCIVRKDDNAETMRVRLKAYHENCDAVLATFATVCEIVRVDGLQPIETIADMFFCTIEKAVLKNNCIFLTMFGVSAGFERRAHDFLLKGTDGSAPRLLINFLALTCYRGCYVCPVFECYEDRNCLVLFTPKDADKPVLAAGMRHIRLDGRKSSTTSSSTIDVSNGLSAVRTSSSVTVSGEMHVFHRDELPFLSFGSGYVYELDEEGLNQQHRASVPVIVRGKGVTGTGRSVQSWIKRCWNSVFGSTHLGGVIRLLKQSRQTTPMEQRSLYAVRRSVEADQNDVVDFEVPTKDDRKVYFGRVLLGNVIETSLLALTVTDAERSDRHVGFATFNDIPPGELAECTPYSAYLEDKYELPMASTFLYLTYYAQRQSVSSAAASANANAVARPSIMKQVLHAVFSTLTTVQRVLLVLPIEIEIESEPTFHKFFERVPVRETNRDVNSGLQYLKDLERFEQYAVYQAIRTDLLPPVHVRKARVEDHDDLDPILKKQRDELVGAFGDYFLAELIREQNDNNVCLVAQARETERAIGLLSLSTDLDVGSLQESFDLAPYNNFAKSNVRTVRAGKITPPRLVIAGPPAGGKGTQCELLVEEFGVIHLSTGDMLRAAIQAKTPLGKEAQQFMDAGELVPDELIIDVILNRLQHADCKAHGWLLDGFPRTASQAQAMVQYGILPDVVILLDVPDDEVVKRISGRRIDPETGKTYHIEFNPPPPDEALRARLIQRSDDTEETIRNRLVKFHENVDAVVGTFAATSKLLRVNGMQNKQVLAQSLVSDIHSVKLSQTFKVMVKRQHLQPPKIIIAGPPAGGKGTQCELLVEQFDVVHLSTGDMLRASVQALGPLGLKAKSYMDAGELVPDDLIINVILDSLRQPDCQERGWLLDGFPRTSIQARAMLAHGIIPDVLMVLEVPDDEVVRRISGRRVDPTNGKTYHMEFNPPPPDVRDRVVQRSDDNEATVRNRLDKYHIHIDHVINTFAEGATAVQVVRCDGNQPKTDVLQEFTAPIYKRLHDLEAAHHGNLEELNDIEARRNCFAITLFCIEDRFDYGATDLLLNAFATFADREFCLMSLPTTAPEPPFLQLFTLVPCRPHSTFTHVLYLLHRDAISFFCPYSEGESVLQRVALTVQRCAATSLESPDMEELKPLLAVVDPPTRVAIQQDIVAAVEEIEIDLEDNPKVVVFLVRANGVVVGLASLSRNHDLTSALKHHFNLDQYLLMNYHRSKEHAIVQQFVLNPVFHTCAQFVLRELMRLFRKTCLFYMVPVRGASHAVRKSAAITPVFQEFILAPPRRSIEISGEEVRQYPDDAEKIKQNEAFDEFALFVLSKKLLSEAKIVINQRIVLVGASDTALTCLQRLLSVPYLRFTSLTLISPDGLSFAEMLPPSQQPRTATPHDFARRSLFTAAEVEQFSPRTHLRIIDSKVVQIDRQTKAVLLLDGSCLPYDYLVLATGLQDGTCTALGRLPSFDGDMYRPAAVPERMIALSTVPSAQRLHDLLLNERTAEEDGQRKIIVYGGSLFALQVIHGLLMRGIDGSRVVHLSPARGSLFEDAQIRGEIDKTYDKHHIAVQYNRKIQLLVIDDATNTLQAVKITAATSASALAFEDDPASGGHRGHPGHDGHHATHGQHHHAAKEAAQDQTLQCSLLICCQQNDADYDIFRAVNESGLVYDGRLVVNGHFRTTDPHIFGGGSLCRFSRRFIHAKMQENYNARECGQLLASSLLRMLDPLSAGVGGGGGSAAQEEQQTLSGSASQPKLISRKSVSSSGSSSSLLSPNGHSNGQNVIPPPDMHMPVLRAAVLPNHKHYLQISVPTLTNTMSLQSLTTSVPGRYTSLLFDDFNVLNRFEYCGDEAVEANNLQCLVGMHESYLNSAVESFASGFVTDWIQFFRQKWTSALYHDRFQEFCVHLSTFLKKDDGIKQLVDDINKFFQETGDLKGATAMAQVRVGRGGNALQPSTKRMVESQVLEFLGTNREILNMYLLPRSSSSSHKHAKHTK
ncbi:TPA: hypothetical protein N0F65_008423 [Lagenidium giganteum]|uniref:Adenylate kinase n=1 Tax=Lagenidium giganteum TaxID=4803 RepID=A0AAV2Z0H7_9STRA|nr:TPA: hypothetical protein N0F65_008423 [Lagenidium giganteum]